MKYSRLLPVVFVLLVVMSAVAVIFWPETFHDPVYPSSRVIRYGFTVQNPTSRPLTEAGFWVFAPLPQTPTQLRNDIKASTPYVIRRDDLGNEKLIFTFEIPPNGTREIWIESTLGISDIPNRFPAESAILAAAGPAFADSSAPEIRKQAELLRKNDTAQSSRAIYDWVKQHITYSGYLRDDRGALYALRTGHGDCTEYAYLTAALGQAQKLPARVMAGFVVQRDGVLSPADYHNWAEYRWDHAWRLVDPQKEAFLESSSRYIAMRIVGDTGTDRSDNTQRFFEGFGGAQVVMKTPVHQVK